MKNKKTLLTILLLLCIALVAGTVVGCDSHSQDETIEKNGTYYFVVPDAPDSEYLLTLENGNFTLHLATTYSGTYKFDGERFTFVVDDNAIALSATLAKDVLSLTIADETYRFLEKIDYTVSLMVDGKVASTQIVTNGKNAILPETPVKENYVFVGWYSDAAFSDGCSFPFVVTKDVAVYARFVPESTSDTEFDVTLVATDKTYASIKTVNGVAYNLPVPEASGKTFVGWWSSVKNDASKLTAQYQEEKLYEHTTLYAVWEEDSALRVSASERAISWNALGANVNYSIKITNGNGDSVYSVNQSATTCAYDFSALDAGEYKIEITANGKTGVAYYGNKLLPSVSLFSVTEEFTLLFNAIEQAEKYELKIQCGEDEYTQELTSTAFDFSEYPMGKDGIRFSVVAKADGYSSSESAPYVVKYSIDSVTGLKYDANEYALAWDKAENVTSYVVAITANGKTATKTVSETTFSLVDYTGELSVAVTPAVKGYYAEPALLSFTKTTLCVPTDLALQQTTLSWNAVVGAAKYNVKIGNGIYETTTNSFNITAEHLKDDAESYQITVQAVAGDAANNSPYSEAISLTNGKITKVSYSQGKVRWNPVFSAAKYEVYVNNEKVGETNETDYAVTFAKAGEHKLSVRYCTASDKLSEPIATTVTVYAITFDANGGAAADTLYKAIGDAIQLPETSNTGYTFTGWTLDGSSYTSDTFEANGNITLKATWSANVYSVNLSVEDGSVSSETTTVTYGQYAKLPVATPTDGHNSFLGWYDADDNRFTDESGALSTVWLRASNDTTLYAKFAKAFSYTSYDGGETYVVSKGAEIGSFAEVTVPSKYNGKPVTSVESFVGCDNLITINIPNTITNVETGIQGGNNPGSAFQGCTKLSAVNVYEAGTAGGYSSVDGVLLYTDADGVTELKYFPRAKTGEYVLPDHVNVLGTYVFRSIALDKITISAGVSLIQSYAFAESTISELVFADGETPLTIEEYAFKSSAKLQSITLPARLNDLKISAFTYCNELAAVNVAEGSSVYSSYDGVLYQGSTLLYCPMNKTGAYTVRGGTETIAEDAFKACTRLSSLTIPGSVTSIDKEAFRECFSLESITFTGEEEDKPLTIQESAFAYCNSLTELSLPINLSAIGAKAFQGCQNLKSVELNASNENLSIANDAFDGVSITSLSLGEKAPLIDIGKLFGGATLATVTVAEGNLNYRSVDDVLYNSDITALLYFPVGKTADTYTVPDTVKTIGTGLFNNVKINRIVFGKNLEEISASAFADSSIVGVDFGSVASETLTIGANAFKNTALTEIALPTCLKEIGESAFQGCTELTTITVPEGVKTIGNRAFYGCEKLKTIALPASLTNLGGYIAGATPSGVEVFGGCNALESVSVAEGNGVYATRNGILYGVADGALTALFFCPLNCNGNNGTVTVPNSVKAIWANAFYSNKGVKKVQFDGAINGALTIGDQAFYACSALQEITLPEGLTEIGSNMFNGCTALKSVVIPSTVEAIGQAAFGGCSALTGVTFTEGTKPLVFGKEGTGYASQASAVFYGCTSLQTLTLPDRITQIGPYAFAAAALTSVNIPKNLTSINRYAFNGCASLESVTFPENCAVTQILSNAFDNCSALTEIDLTKATKLTKLEQYAFRYCRALTSVKLPADLKTIDIGVFTGCSKLASVDFTAATALETIGNNAFQQCSALTSVTIPASVTSIGSYTFQYCSVLNSVTFADGSNLSSIGSYAFANTALKSFAFPETENPITLPTQYGCLFSYCTQLTSLYISKSITSLVDILNDCKSIKTITVSADSEYYKVQDGALILLNPTGNKIELAYEQLSGEYTIPEGITTIGDYAFAKQSQLTSIVLPASLTTIQRYAFQQCNMLKTVKFADGSALESVGERAFASCGQLTEIAFPANDVAMGDSVFQYCYSLKSATLPKSIVATKHGTETTSRLGKRIFEGCSQLATLVFPENFTGMGEYMFYQIGGLKEITIPDTITEIPQYAFAYCSSLRSITFPDTLTAIGDYAFAGCGTNYNQEQKYLTSITIPEGVTSLGKEVFSGCSKLETVYLNNVTSIGERTFANCSNLTTIDLSKVTTIGNSAFNNAFNNYQATTTYSIDLSAVTSLGQSAFEGCSKLGNITLGSGLTELPVAAFFRTAIKSIDLSSVTSVGERAVAMCNELTEIILSENLTSIGNMAFYQNQKLESISLPGTVKSIGTGVFQNCPKLTTVTLPETLTEIGSYMFYGCSELETIDLSHVTKIGSDAFASCSKLSSIQLSENLTSIGDRAFEKTGLSTVKLPASLTSIGSKAFGECANLETFVVEDGNACFSVLRNGILIDIENEKLIACPRSLSGDITIVGVKTIAAYAFANLSEITSVTLGDSVTVIEQYAFQNCTNLTSVFALGELKEISAYAFQGCTRLDSVTLPQTVTVIGSYAFQNCSSLTAIDLTNVETICSSAFQNCSSLTAIDLANVKTIGSSAFSGCTALSDITFGSELTTVEGSAFSNSGIIEFDALNTKLTTLGYNAFSNATRLTTVKTPATLSDLGFGVFQGATALETLHLDGKMQYLTWGAFQNVTSLKSVWLSDSILNINGYAFSGCTSLSEIKLPAKLKELGSNVFQNTAITSITLPSTVAYTSSWGSFGSYLFAGCTKLEFVDLSGVQTTSLDVSIFQGCTALKEVKLPNTLTTLGAVFNGCSELESVTIPASVTVIGANAFKGCTKLTITAEASEAASGWATDWNLVAEGQYVPVNYGTSNEE